jgi:hypothetical protein
LLGSEINPGLILADILAPMRISFDMDGVLADMDAALARIAAQEFGKAVAAPPREAVGEPTEGAPSATPSATPSVTPSVTPQAEPDALPSAMMAGLSSRQQTRLWQRVRETRNFWETLKECEPGTVGRLQRLAHHRRWDVLFVTQRPSTAGRTAQLQTQHWLRRHGFEYPAVYTTQGSRGLIAAALTLDVHIDDRLENCVNVASDSRAWPILVWRDDESFARISAGSARLGIATVATVGEAMDKIEEAERGLADQQDHTTLMGRLKRAFTAR